MLILFCVLGVAIAGDFVVFLCFYCLVWFLYCCLGLVLVGFVCLLLFLGLLIVCL